jgi:hypothetical protein
MLCDKSAPAMNPQQLKSDQSPSASDESSGGNATIANVPVPDVSPETAFAPVNESSAPVNKRSRSHKPHTNLSNKQKIMILNQLDRKEITVGKACLKYNLSRNTVPNWRKERENIEKQVKEEGRPEKKRAMVDDGLERIRAGLKSFYDDNLELPEGLKQPLTRKLLCLYI